MVFTNHGAVRRNHNHFKLIDGHKLFRFRICGTGHSCQLFIHTEIVLKCNTGQSLVLILYIDTFFCLQSLVQTIAVSSSVHHTTGKFIDDDYLSITNHVIDFIFKNTMCFYSLVQAMQGFNVCGVIKVFDIQVFFHLCYPFLSKGCCSSFFINGVMFFFLQAGNKFIDLIIFIRGLFCRSGYDQWSPRLID